MAYRENHVRRQYQKNADLNTSTLNFYHSSDDAGASLHISQPATSQQIQIAR
jgi:hypothetical protein